MLILLISLFACATETRELDIMAINGDAAKGEALFATCTGCHGADGAGDENIRGAGGRGALETIMYGEDEMPAYEGWADQDLADVLAYVETL
jgi:mono/diheme cytochrome c family protein